MKDEIKPSHLNAEQPASKPDPRVTTVYGDSRPLARDGMLRDILASQKDFSKMMVEMIWRQRDILSRQVYGYIFSFLILLFVAVIWSQLQEISASVKSLQEGQQICAGGPLD